MSAVPNVPEGVQDQREQIPDAVTKGLLQNEQSNVHVNGESKPSQDFKLHDIVVENFRPVKVIVIGAGYSGIYCGIRIPERLRNCDLTIYEKNAGIGGTWYAYGAIEMILAANLVM